MTEADGHLRSRADIVTLAEDCPALRFSSKFADIVALGCGRAGLLSPVFDRRATGSVAPSRGGGREVALVLGANGFVGTHLVAALTRQPGIRKVYAAVRSTPDLAGGARLQATLTRYRIHDIDLDKIVPTPADLTKRNFGLADDEYTRLLEDTDFVFSCASSTDYSRSYLELRNDWVLSLLRVLQFSVERRRKHLTYLGSVGASFYRNPSDFRRPDSWWYSGYCQMKWVNGALLRALFDVDDVSVTLCEAPYVLGSTAVGLDPGRHYSWWRLIDLAATAGAIWKGPGMNYIPVDVLAEVVANNALADGPLNYLLPCNPIGYHNTLFADLLDLDLVEWPDFVRLVSHRISPRYQDTLLSSNVDALIRIVNEPGPTLPRGHDPSWCDNRRLFGMYLRNIDFRASSRREVA